MSTRPYRGALALFVVLPAVAAPALPDAATLDYLAEALPIDEGPAPDDPLLRLLAPDAALSTPGEPRREQPLFLEERSAPRSKPPSSRPPPPGSRP